MLNVLLLVTAPTPVLSVPDTVIELLFVTAPVCPPDTFSVPPFVTSASVPAVLLTVAPKLTVVVPLTEPPEAFVSVPDVTLTFCPIAAVLVTLPAIWVVPDEPDIFTPKLPSFNTTVPALLNALPKLFAVAKV